MSNIEYQTQSHIQILNVEYRTLNQFLIAAFTSYFTDSITVFFSQHKGLAFFTSHFWKRIYIFYYFNNSSCAEYLKRTLQVDKLNNFAGYLAVWSMIILFACEFLGSTVWFWCSKYNGGNKEDTCPNYRLIKLYSDHARRWAFFSLQGLFNLFL